VQQPLCVHLVADDCASRQAQRPISASIYSVREFGPAASTTMLYTQL